MEEQISLTEIFGLLRKRLGQIITWASLGLLIAALFTFFMVTPKYQSTSKLVVNQTQNTSQTITNTDIQTNLNLIKTYQSIIQEPIILEDVLDMTSSSLTAEELREKITVDTEANSLVFGVTVTDENPYTASELANAIANSFEQKIGDILEVKSVTILSTAVPNIQPVSPNIMVNLGFGLVVGMIIGVISALLAEILNKTVKDDKFIESLGWVNLGSVLEMSADEVKNTSIRGAKPLVQPTVKVSRRRV